MDRRGRLAPSDPPPGRPRGARRRRARRRRPRGRAGGRRRPGRRSGARAAGGARRRRSATSRCREPRLDRLAAEVDAAAWAEAWPAGARRRARRCCSRRATAPSTCSRRSTSAASSCACCPSGTPVRSPPAAQRLPPLHRRPAPVGGGGQRRRPGRPGGPPRPAGARRPAPRHRQGLPGRPHRSPAWRWCATIGPRLGLGARRRRRRSWRWSSTTCCCPTSRSAATSTDPATIRQVAEAVGDVELLDLLARADRGRLAGHRPVGVGHVEGRAGRRSRRPHAHGPGRRSSRREVTGQPFPDPATLAIMAAGPLRRAHGADDPSVRRRDGTERITVVCDDVPGAFARIAGVLSLRGLDVLTAWAYSGELGGPPMAASQFRVVPPACGIDWERGRRPTSAHALDGQLAIEARLAERARTYRRRRRVQAAAGRAAGGDVPRRRVAHRDGDRGAGAEPGRRAAPHHPGPRRARPRHPPRHRADARRGRRRHVLRARPQRPAGSTTRSTARRSSGPCSTRCPESVDDVSDGCVSDDGAGRRLHPRARPLERGAGRHRPHRPRLHREPLRAGALRGGAARRRRHQGAPADRGRSRSRPRAGPLRAGVAGVRRRGRARLRDAEGRHRRHRRQRRTARCCSSSAPTRGIWLYPTGWADVGYSPAEVAVKEVLEETGIECEARRGSSPSSTASAWASPGSGCTCCCSTAAPSAASCSATRSSPPTSAGSRATPCPRRRPGVQWWKDMAFAAIDGEAVPTSLRRGPQPHLAQLVSGAAVCGCGWPAASVFG